MGMTWTSPPSARGSNPGSGVDLSDTFAACRVLSYVDRHQDDIAETRLVKQTDGETVCAKDVRSAFTQSRRLVPSYR